jgi:hypothetical protein
MIAVIVAALALALGGGLAGFTWLTRPPEQIVVLNTRTRPIDAASGPVTSPGYHHAVACPAGQECGPDALPSQGE